MTAPLCVVCVHERDDEGKRFLADYGQPTHPRASWPMTEVAGHPVHLTCRSTLDHALRFAVESEWCDGAYRWYSNGQAAPDDCVRMAVRLGLATRSGLDQHIVTNRAETDAFLAAYRRNQTPPSAEQLAEMRAAFGPGETVVDVISGRRIEL